MDKAQKDAVGLSSTVTQFWRIIQFDSAMHGPAQQHGTENLLGDCEPASSSLERWG